MISFIIIGRNIQKTIKICIRSVFEFIQINKIHSHEIIYIDSDSSDNTLFLAKNYPIRIFLTTGNVNAAIARNVGAQNAKGDILFFLDGDMELLPQFWEFVFDRPTKSLKYPFARGHMMEKYYDCNFDYVYSKDEAIAKEPYYEHVTGGLMIVEKRLWEKIRGMDERLIRNQDLDFGLRMTGIGIPVLKDNHYWIIHHTSSYFEKNRMSYFFKSKALFTPGILMRKHIFNLNYLKYSKRNVFYVLLLFVSLILLIINPWKSLLVFLFYVLIQLVRSISGLNKERHFFDSFLFKILYNVYSIIGLLFYYPRAPIYKLTCIKD